MDDRDERGADGLLTPRALAVAALLLLPAPLSGATDAPWRPALEAMAEAHHLLPAGLLARVRRYEGDIVCRDRK